MRKNTARRPSRMMRHLPGPVIIPASRPRSNGSLTGSPEPMNAPANDSAIRSSGRSCRPPSATCWSTIASPACTARTSRSRARSPVSCPTGGLKLDGMLEIECRGHVQRALRQRERNESREYPRPQAGDAELSLSIQAAVIAFASDDRGGACRQWQ